MFLSSLMQKNLLDWSCSEPFVLLIFSLLTFPEATNTKHIINTHSYQKVNTAILLPLEVGRVQILHWRWFWQCLEAYLVVMSEDSAGTQWVDAKHPACA